MMIQILKKSLQEFPQFVNNIAGYDVEENAIENPQKTYYDCTNEITDDQRYACSTRFLADINGEEFNIIVDMNLQEKGYTGKDIEIVVMPVE